MLEIQKAISEVNSLDFGRLDTAGQEINELENKSIKIVHTEPHCQKKVWEIEQTCTSCGTSSLTYL